MESANWTVTWRLYPEGRGTRLFLEHTRFDPDDPVQQLSRTIMDSRRRSHVLRRLANGGRTRRRGGRHKER